MRCSKLPAAKSVFSYINVAVLGSSRILPTSSFQRQARFCTEVKMSFYNLKAKKLDGTEFQFSSLKGKVVLVENTASL